MKTNPDDSEKASRRQFTKAALTAAVVAPLAASIISCRGEDSGGPRIKSCDSSLGKEEHIPPMGFDGSGSLRIESSNKLMLLPSTPPYFSYQEDGISDPDDRYGELEAVRVISELYPNPPKGPYVTDVSYLGLKTLGCQLLLWYQPIEPTTDPGPDVFPDDSYKPMTTFPAADPHVRIVGGVSLTTNYFKLTLKHKPLPERPEKTHKPGRPYRYRHEADATIPELGRHFRIGQWKVVGRDGVTIVAAGFEHKGAVDYRIYPTFGHFHEH